MIFSASLYSPHVVVFRIYIISNKDTLFVSTGTFLRDFAFAVVALDPDFSPRLMGAYAASVLRHHELLSTTILPFLGPPSATIFFAVAYWPP